MARRGGRRYPCGDGCRAADRRRHAPPAVWPRPMTSRCTWRGSGMQWLDGRPYDFDFKHPPVARAMAAYARAAGRRLRQRPAKSGARGQRDPPQRANVRRHADRRATRHAPLPRHCRAGRCGVGIAALRPCGVLPCRVSAGHTAAGAGSRRDTDDDMRWPQRCRGPSTRLCAGAAGPLRNGALLGFAMAAALMTKFSAMVFLPGCVLVALLTER